MKTYNYICQNTNKIIMICSLLCKTYSPTIVYSYSDLLVSRISRFCCYAPNTGRTVAIGRGIGGRQRPSIVEHEYIFPTRICLDFCSDQSNIANYHLIDSNSLLHGANHLKLA